MQGILKSLREQPPLLLWVCLISVVAAFALRTYFMMNSVGLLNYDEIYYLNLGIQGAAGRGLHFYIMGYEPVPIVGGAGYITLLYVWAVQLLGPTVTSIRLVALIASALTLIPIFMFSRIWFGSTTALITMMILPWTSVFTLTHSGRVDALAMFVASCGVWAVAVALERRRWSWHLAAGLVFGAALHVHLVTLVMAFACGLLYLFYSAQIWRSENWKAALQPIIAYGVGLLIGLLSYVALNILPNPDAYFRVVSSTREYLMGLPPQSGIGTWFTPEALLLKELARYNQLINQVSPPAEWVLIILSVIALLVRRTKSDLYLITLVIGIVIGSGIILNNGFMFLAPTYGVLGVIAASFLAQGFRREVQRSAPELGLLTACIFAASSIGIQFSVPLHSWAPIHRLEHLQQIDERDLPPEYVHDALRVVSSADQIVGASQYYIPYFVDYLNYVSYSEPEEILGMRAAQLRDPVEYWSLIDPDVIYGEIRPGISAFIAAADYRLVAPSVWVRPDYWITPAAATPEIIFDDRVAVYGIALDRPEVRACETVRVASWWGLLDALPSGYSVGMHLVDSSGSLVTQQDGPAAQRNMETLTLYPNYLDLRSLTIPCGTAAGVYSLTLSVYHYETLTPLVLTQPQTTGSEIEAITLRVVE
jgi:4-amino-4-deoxy-L-arabinose transferase-like glycosyltransferase